MTTHSIFKLSHARRLAYLLISLTATSLTACGGGGDSKPAPFRITPSTNSVSTDYAVGTTPTAMMLSASGSGEYSGNLYVSGSIDGEGVQAPISIVVSGMTATITIFPKSGLAVGDYTGRVTLLACSDFGCANQVGGSPFVINYAVKVVGISRPVDVVRAVTSETTEANLNGSVTITGVSRATTPPWTASDNASWLTLTRANGVFGDTLDYRIDKTQLALLPNGVEQTAAVTVSSVGLPNTSFQIRLQKNIGDVIGTGPHAILSGVAQPLIIRGHGFAAISDLSSRIAISGVTPVSFSRVNDTEVVAQLPPLAAGNRSITVSNTLGLTAITESFAVVDARAYTYAAVPNGNDLTMLQFDPEREALYAVSRASGALVRFKYASGAWTRTEVPSPGVHDLALSNDGTKLVVSFDAGIRLVDPDSLATLTTLPYLGIGPSTAGEGNAATNDGKIWMRAGYAPGYDGGGFVVFDTNTNTFTSDNDRRRFYNGPWFAVSRNGERLLAPQSAGVSPPPPMLYADAADGILNTTPTGMVPFFYSAMFSDNAEKVLFDAYVVYDRDFRRVGRLETAGFPYPQHWISWTSAISPDGNRCYGFSEDLNVLPIQKPRVIVYDCSTVLGDNPLPILGYFSLPTYVRCWGYDPACTSASRVNRAISLDGRTLFFVSNGNFMVMPIPTTLTPLM